MTLHDPALDQPERRPVGWCPACRKMKPCTLTSGTTDWQVAPVFTCDSCGALTREPLIRLANVMPEVAVPVEV
jgi:hypothetical protein